MPNAILYISEGIPETHEFIKNVWEDVDIFVAIGGDGTISTVASQIIHTEKILAIIPAGSGNGFSIETNFSKNFSRLMEKIAIGNTKKIDTFFVNNFLSINVSGVGFDGKVTKDFEKSSRGFLNYVRLSTKIFFNFKPIKLKFKTVELTHLNGKYLMMNIANTRQFGNNAYIAPHASKSDGKVEVVLVKKFPILHGLLFAKRLFAKELHKDPYVTYASVSEFIVKVNTKNWHVDGDFKKIKSPVHIRVLPGSLTILV